METVGYPWNTLVPPEDDIYCAGMYLKSLDESSISILKIWEIRLFAKCDFYYRKDNTVKVLEIETAACNLQSK